MVLCRPRVLRLAHPIIPKMITKTWNVRSHHFCPLKSCQHARRACSRQRHWGLRSVPSGRTMVDGSSPVCRR